MHLVIYLKNITQYVFVIEFGVIEVLLSPTDAQENCFKRNIKIYINPLNTELNPICYLLALLGAHHFLHVSRIKVKSLTLRLLMSYIYIYIYIYI